MLDGIICLIGSCALFGGLSLMALGAAIVAEILWEYIRRRWFKRGS